MHNSFSLLNLPVSFQIQPAALDKAYRVAIAACHPDRHQVDPMLRVQAEQMSAMLNQAHATLADPLLRAEHLLSLAGITAAGHTLDDKEFLMQQLTWREKVANAELGEKARMQQQVTEYTAQVSQHLAQLFEQNWRQDKEVQKRIKQTIHHLSFWYKLRCQLT